MKEIILITGANGLIATHTAEILEKSNYEIRFLTRSPQKANEYKWDPMNNEIDEKALEGISYIIHLSGAPFHDGSPLTEERKKLLWGTRIGAGELLLQKLKDKNRKLKAFISASALGHYAFSADEAVIDEAGKVADTYEAVVTTGWEKVADQFKTDGVAERVVKLRICLVLGPEGRLFLDFKSLLNADPVGFKEAKGSTYFPWVHADDMGGMFAYAVMNDSLEGVFNTTAPEVTSQQAIFKLMYYANQQDNEGFDKVDTAFSGQHLTSAKIIDAGYKFNYPNIKSAIKDLMK